MMLLLVILVTLVALMILLLVILVTLVALMILLLVILVTLVALMILLLVILVTLVALMILSLVILVTLVALMILLLVILHKRKGALKRRQTEESNILDQTPTDFVELKIIKNGNTAINRSEIALDVEKRQNESIVSDGDTSVNEK